MFDWKKFVTVSENGEMLFDEKGFKSAYDSDFNKSLDSKESNLREKIRAELEEEAKLSAEEKIKKEREALQAELIKTRVEINREKAKAKMEGKFTDKEIERHLRLITDDANTLKDIDDIIAEKLDYEKKLESNFKQKYAITQPQPNTETSAKEVPSQTQKSRQDISKIYE